MFELFLNPWSFAAGAGLVAVPIVIHLINRMRFRRVKWAAMEFLLKAQKRMKRKLIFQQLLLLALRCLTVFLLGLLVGRFVGCEGLSGRDTRLTAHVALIDDSPSMGDGWRGEDGADADSFGLAKRVLVEQIGPAAAQATTPQTLDVVRLSAPGTPRSFGRLNPTTIAEAKGYLDGYTASTVRGGLADALRKAKDVFPSAAGQDVARVLHVLSDFRAGDWEQDGPAVRQAIEELTTAGVKVHLVDVAHPFRKDEKRPPLFHDNVAITELTPSRLQVARFEPVEFTLRVRNYGAAELKDLRFAVSVNGDDNRGQSVAVPSLPGNEERTVRFNLTLDRVGTAEKPLDRFSLVTAKLETQEPGGLKVDNVRFAVVEVREKLPVLVVDGRPGDRDRKEGDSFYLRTIFTSVVGGFNWVPGQPRDLEGDLRQYSSVYLLNVPALSEAAAKNLEQYVRDGGGAAFFLGPDVKPEEYNARLYADGNGLFPVPLPGRPTDPLPEEKRLQRAFSLQKKVLVRDKEAKRHPALRGMYFDDRDQPVKEEDLEKFFSFVTVSQYWPVARLGKWLNDRSVTELYCMPNERPMGEFDALVDALLKKVNVGEPKYAKYRDAVDALKTKVRQVSLSTEPLFKLADALDALLADQRTEGDATEALVREFWALPDVAAVRSEAARLRDAVKFGDPLYLAKQFGRGRVAVVTTTAGERWTDWPSGPGRPSFVPVMTEMERYLSGGGADENRSAGQPITVSVDAARYKPTAGRAVLTFDPTAGGNRGPAAATTLTDLKEQALVTEGGRHTLRFADTAKPGAYLVTLTQVRGQSSGAEAAEVPEYQAFAVNVDAKREGDLRRAARDDVLQQAPGAELHSAGDPAWLDRLKNKQTDWTERGWIFLALLAVLVAEQALAVRLSYHTAAGTLEAAAPSAAAVFGRSTGPAAREPEPEPVTAG
jgi:hypothetical protein